MEERSPSSTALGVAALRAAHQLIDGEPKILDDPVVLRLLDPQRVGHILAKAQHLQKPEAIGLRSHIVLRNRYAEDRLAEAVRRGIRQYVLLGAGFDTFAYRQPEWAHDIRVFEVDHLASQRLKRERLELAGISIPSNVELVAIDFEHVSLRTGLLRSSLDFRQPTFFSCLGVTMYLTEDAAEGVFRLVTSFPRTSELVFTFAAPDSSANPSGPAQPNPAATRAAAKGEPWLTRFELESLVAKLRGLGFLEIDPLVPAEAEARYFRDRADGLRAPSRINIMSAAV